MTEAEGTLIIAIDGPSGVGKSTVARLVGERLDLPYLSTGAMYRAVALKVLESGTDPDDRGAVEAVAAACDMRLEVDDGEFQVVVDGRRPGRRAYLLEVSAVTSRISTYPGVRKRMVELQRLAAEKSGGVLEGRDVGTRVFPTARHKFFLDATADVRTERRWRQLEGSGATAGGREAVRREVEERDLRDSTRADSPLTRDASYVIIATDELSASEVADLIVESVRSTGRETRGSSL